MEINQETDLSHQVRVCSFKLVDAYSTILKKAQVPEKQGLEDTLQPFSINISSESILSTCRMLLDIIQEARVRKLLHGANESFEENR